MKNKFLIVSLHDVHAGNYLLFDAFIDDLQQTGIKFLSILVVPDMHKIYSFAENSGFRNWLLEKQSNGHEIVLHGYYHYEEKKKGGIIKNFIGSVYTSHEGEFFRISTSEAKKRLSSGLDMLGSAGLEIFGFVAPAWLANDNTLSVLRNTDLFYTTKLSGIALLKEKIFLNAPVLSFSSRSSIKRIFSVIWARVFGFVFKFYRVVRLAVHPADLQNTYMKKTLLSEIKKINMKRKNITYRRMAKLYVNKN